VRKVVWGKKRGGGGGGAEMSSCGWTCKHYTVVANIMSHTERANRRTINLGIR